MLRGKNLPFLVILSFFVLASLFSNPVFCFAQQTENAESSTSAHNADVAPFGETLFSVYGDIGSVTAAKRAKIISENIVNLSKDAFYKAEYLKVEAAHDTVNVIYKEDVIAGITARQAEHAGKSQSELASEYFVLIKDAIQNERQKHLRILRLEEVAVALLIIVLTFLCIKGLNLLGVYIRNFFARKKNINLLDGQELSKEMKLTFKIIRTVKAVLVIVIIAVCILLFLWLFPATRWVVESLLTYIEKPLLAAFIALWHYIPNLIEIIILIVLFRLFERALHYIAKKIDSGALKIKGFDRDWAIPTFQIARVLIIVFAFIFIFPLLPKADSSIFKGISVFMGVLLSLGSTSMISNIVSGLVITYMRPFNVGDRILMGQHFGDVVEKNSLVTRIKTTKNEIVTIPNSTIMTANTTNYTNSAKKYGLILHSNVTVGYDVDWRQVHKLLIEAALKTSGVLKDPQPFVHQIALDDFYVKYEINAYINDASKMTGIYSELFQNLQDIFNREKIELLSPIFNHNINEDFTSKQVRKMVKASDPSPAKK